MNTTNTSKVRRTASKAVRRHQLITATIESIAKNGISGTTMTTVTRGANLSMGIVNFHFKSKELLFQETLMFLAEEHRSLWLKNLNDNALTPLDKLLSLVDAHFHPSICNRQKLAVWFAFFGEAKYRESYRNKIAEIDSERIHETELLCRSIIEDGNYCKVDPMMVTKNLEGLYDGLWLNILLYPKLFSRLQAKAQIRDYLSTIFPDHLVSQTMPKSKTE